MKLKGKVAIITGGARGIGHTLADRFAEEGAAVVLADVLDGAAAAARIAERGGQAISLITDVADEESTRRMAQAVIDRFGRIDILVNNAAVFVTLGKKSFMDISSEEWDRVLAVNLKGMFNCCKSVYPQMKKQGKGKIINISSSTVFQGVPLFLHYVSSKGGVIAFTRALARELGDESICVNAIAPGLTASEAVRAGSMYTEDYLRAAAQGRSFKRIQLPEDLAGPAVFLASDESDFMTGQTLAVDGGSVMH